MIFGYRREELKAAQEAKRARGQELSERAAELEKAAERFRLAGNEKMAASLAEEAAALHRAGA